jgi:hypothetical protein
MLSALLPAPPEFQPGALTITAATLAAWVGSHLFGVGEIVDLALLAAGVVTLGFAVFEGAGALYEFAEKGGGARISADLDTAASSFAKAVTLLGISTIQAIIMRTPGKAVGARGVPKARPRVELPPPPPAGNQLRVARPPSLPLRSSGGTDAYGSIQIARNQVLSEQRLALYHELVHRYFSPRTGPRRRLRAKLAITAYERSAFLRYLEEGLAEGYAQLRVNGLGSAAQQWRFPLDNGYVTVSQLLTEGQAIGSLILGTQTFQVSISLGPIRQQPARR